MPSVDTTALNYAEYVLLENKPDEARATAMVFIQSGSVMQDIKVLTDNSLSVKGMRHIGLEAAPAWGDVNAELTTVKNLPKPYAEQLYLCGFKLPISKVYINAKNSGGEARLFDKQVVPALKAQALDFNYKFFNNRRIGASGDDKNVSCFNGLRFRLSSVGRTMYDIPAECKITVTADITAANISAAAVAKVSKALSNALEIMDAPEGDGVIFYANESVWSALEASWTSTSNSLFGNDTDPFGRRVMTFRNAKLRRAGRGVPSITGAQSQVLLNTETDNGEAITGGSKTSIFGVKSGDQAFQIRQFREPSIMGPMDMDDQMTRQVAWYNLFGLDQMGTRSIVQLCNIAAD